MVSKWLITYLEMRYIAYWACNPLFVTIDPNFQQDIPAPIHPCGASARWVGLLRDWSMVSCHRWGMTQRNAWGRYVTRWVPMIVISGVTVGALINSRKYMVVTGVITLLKGVMNPLVTSRGPPCMLRNSNKSWEIPGENIGVSWTQSPDF